MPERKIVPSSWRYLASSEKSCAIGMAPPAGFWTIWTYDTGGAGWAQIHCARSLMAFQLTVMIEAQEGLTWERWQALARLAEDTGFAGLFRSDHLTGLFGNAHQ